MYVVRVDSKTVITFKTKEKRDRYLQRYGKYRETWLDIKKDFKPKD